MEVVVEWGCSLGWVREMEREFEGIDKWKIGEKEKTSLSYIFKSYSDFEKMVKFGANSYKGLRG